MPGLRWCRAVTLVLAVGRHGDPGVLSPIYDLTSDRLNRRTP